jgi:hypothetical protein
VALLQHAITQVSSACEIAARELAATDSTNAIMSSRLVIVAPSLLCVTGRVNQSSPNAQSLTAYGDDSVESMMAVTCQADGDQ